MVKFLIELEIDIIDKVEKSDINAILKGCKYLNILGYFFKINKWSKSND